MTDDFAGAPPEVVARRLEELPQTAAGRFLIDTTPPHAGRLSARICTYLHVEHLRLGLHDTMVSSPTARSAEANLASGTPALSYKDCPAW